MEKSSSIKDIINNSLEQIRTIIDAGGGRGMQSMDNSIQKQLESGNITAEEAYMKANDKGRFIKQMEEEEAAKGAAAQQP